jgi:DNA-directed RNA polymerase subunit E"
LTARACRNCRFITEGEICPVCKGNSMSDEWFGYVVIIDPVNSEIAKRLNITHPGRYALRVR